MRGPFTYTAFCQETSGRGTIWINAIQAADAEEAKKLAIQECAADWGSDEKDIHLLGLASGTVSILHWEDIE